MRVSREAAKAIAIASAHPALPGYQPPTSRERLEAYACTPLAPRCTQLPYRGLFDEVARSQLDLLDDALRVQQAAESRANTREYP